MEDDDDDEDDGDDIDHSHVSVRPQGYSIMLLRKAELQKNLNAKGEGRLCKNKP
jgi:hypothetical protein